MSEPLRIVCPCGYENWVPEEKRGQTVACFICGEDLLVDDAPEPSSASVEPEMREKPSPISKSRSPFEADELDTAVRPKFQHAPPTPTASSPPTARPRSPFEADVPAEDVPFRRGNEEKFVADPFSRELVPAPKPTPSMADEMERHRPTDRRNRNVFIETISPHDAPTGEKCMQCGRALRGSWDRVETHLGVFCYVCSNQATQDIPDRVKTGRGRPAEMHEHDLLVDPVHIRNAAPIEPKYGVTQTPGFKKLILWMACSVLAITVFVWFTGWGSYTGSSRSAGIAEAPPRIPDFIRYIVWTVRGFGSFLGAVLAIYLTLDRDNRVPHERFFMNFINIGALVVLLYAVLLGILFVRHFFIEDPMMALMFNIFSSMLFFGMAIYMLVDWFDFLVSDFLWLWFFYMPAVQGVIAFAGYFLQWGLYEWVL